jgi:hypothetical protein
MRLKSGNGGFDDGTLPVTEHWGDLLKAQGPVSLQDSMIHSYALSPNGVIVYSRAEKW